MSCNSQLLDQISSSKTSKKWDCRLKFGLMVAVSWLVLIFCELALVFCGLTWFLGGGFDFFNELALTLNQYRFSLLIMYVLCCICIYCEQWSSCMIAFIWLFYFNLLCFARFNPLIEKFLATYKQCYKVD